MNPISIRAMANPQVSSRFLCSLIISFLILGTSLTIGQESGKQSQTDTISSDSPWKQKLLDSKRVVFLGDSNTHNGEYINQIEAALIANFQSVPQVINLGLPSETCCGLSEPIHPFPRPNVQERLGRVLEKAKPDFTFACYGMNDGIYHPFSEDRFEAFKTGIHKIIAAHAKSKIPLVLITPPPFDPLPMKRSGKLVGKDAKDFSWMNIYKEYDAEVIKKYAEWMLTIDQPNCLVLDVHTPFSTFLEETRESKPDFAFSNDGVHFDAAGHKRLAEIIMKELDLGVSVSKDEGLLKLVRKRRSIAHPAWLTEVGHLRPKVKPGLPMAEADEKIAPINKEISELANLKK